LDEDPGHCCSLLGGVLCPDDKDDMVCVTAEHVCADDGTQCADGADEDPRNCCEKSGGMFCAGVQGLICVPQTQVCADDGSQCLDGSDENPQECCKRKQGSLCGSGECIEFNQRCDSASDCADGSDESLVTCGCPEPGQWACQDNSKCILDAQRCNGGEPDCADGSDESQEQCGGGGCPEGMVMCPDKSCAPDPGACDK
jgi:hypothetical protein